MDACALYILLENRCRKRFEPFTGLGKLSILRPNYGVARILLRSALERKGPIMMKKVTAWVTSVCLVFSMFGFPAYGFADSGDDKAQTVALGSGKSVLGVAEADLAAAQEAKEAIDESAAFNLKFSAYGPAIADSSAAGKVAINYQLRNKATGAVYGDILTNISQATTEVPSPEEGDTVIQDAANTGDNPQALNEYYSRLTDLPAGAYELAVTGTGYLPFSQEVELKPHMSTEVTLGDSAKQGAGQEAGSAKRGASGIMPYGDLDGSGAIDDADAAMLVDAIGTPNPAPMLNMYGGDTISLNDVQFFADFFGDGQASPQAANPRYPINTESMAQEIDPSVTKVQGDDDLFADDGKTQTFAPADEGVDISPQTPVAMSFNTKNVEMEAMQIRTPSDSEGAVKAGRVRAILDDDTEITVNFSADGAAPAAQESGSGPLAAIAGLFGLDKAFADEPTALAAGVVDSNGLVTIDFGRRVAVKRITIVITETASNKLAEIAKVEFLNDTEDRIAPPELDVPQGLTATPGKKSFRLDWSPAINITGYEVMVAQGDRSTVFSSVLPSLDVQRFLGSELSNGTVYEVKVRSVNGEWRSPWSDSISVTPKATSAPPAPLGVMAKGGYGEINVSWSASEDATGYILYYRQKSTDAYTEVRLDKTSYCISPLSLSVTFEGYVRAFNDVGTSPNSRMWEATTTGAASVKVPWYNLINRKAQDRSMESHVTSVVPSYPNNDQVNPGFDPLDVVDGDYDTYYHSSYNGNYYAGVQVNFDQTYRIDSVAVTTYLGTGYASHHQFRIIVDDGAGNKKTYYTGGEEAQAGALAVDGKIVPSTFLVTFPESTVKSITVGFQRAYAAVPTISELAFYEADGLQDRLDALWKPDAMYTELADGVTAETLQALKDDIERKDEVSQERHPRYNLLVSQWQLAKDIFDQQDNLTQAVAIDPNIDTTTNAFVGGLNSMQPLGVTVHNGEDLSVFVGGDSVNVGSNTALRLWVAQYHGDSGKHFKMLKSTLVNGRNDIGKVDMSDMPAAVGEQGGALYVQFLSSNRSQHYTVRTFGGTSIPVLDLHGVTDKGQRVALCDEYLGQLRSYVQGLEADHNDKHSGTYNPRECPLNTTDIVIDRIMFSVPASRALDGVGASGDGAKLESTLAKADEMMNLFYQHKGLTDKTLTDAEKAKYGDQNGIPAGRQNIRYTNMSGGVFMYAAGNHIGIQYNESANPTALPGAFFDSNGKWQSGQYYGWGMRHEIGHEINQRQYTYAEVTNNYYSQLGGMVTESDEGMRWSYDSVYDRVTSGLKGMPGGKTGIALYWQLHLAYDDGYNYKQYDNYTEQMENLVFARMDSIARNPSTAPMAEAGGVAFTLSGADRDNALMRLASAATKKNLLPFFEAWGLTPDEGTRSYAAQWPVEERAIQYISDSVREYRITGGGDAKGAHVLADDSNGKQGMTVVPNSSSVVFNLKNDLAGGNQSKFLGYEISRDGVPVGFVKAAADGTATYTDNIATVNNRVFTYSVRGIDNLLNYTEPLTFEPVKVSHNGSIDKSSWTLTSNLYPNGQMPEEDEDYHGGEGQEQPSSPELDNLKDNNPSTSFTGEKLEGDDSRARITIDFGGTYAIWALQVTGDDSKALTGYTIETSLDGRTFTAVTPGEATSDESARITTQFFGNPAKPDDRQLHAYDAGWLRITAPAGQNIATLDEIDVLAPTTDNIDFLDDSPCVGYLAADYDLSADGSGNEGVIPQDSLVFVGRFTGNVAYNAIKLFDADSGKLIGGTQILFADIPEEGNLGKTADGRWVYYIEPGEALDGIAGSFQHVKAELYRVDDAQTLEGERLVAETLPMDVQWQSLGSIQLTDDRS